MTIEEFFVTIGFKADTLKVKEFVGALANLPLEAAAGIAALAGLEFELVKIANEAMNAAVGFQMFGSQTGLSWKELEKWQIVAQQANVSAEAVASSVTALQRQMAEIKLGRGNIAPFQILGIDPRQDAFSVLRQLRERLKGVEPAMATNLIQQMGIDPSMIQLLRLTNNEFDKLAGTVRGMSSDQEGSFLAAKKAVVQFGLAAKYLGYDVVAKLIQDFQTFLDLIRKVQIWMPGLAIAAGALAVAFAPITTAIVALLLVLDDLATYFRGGKSVTGEAIEGLGRLGDELKKHMAVFDSIQKLGQVGAMLAGTVMGPGGMVAGAATRAITQHITMNIHSTAPAHDVGKAAADHLQRAASQASLQTNQQGY